MIVIAGQTVWPIRWRLVVYRAVIALYHLAWWFMGSLAFAALALQFRLLDIRMRWDILDALGKLQRYGVTREAVEILPLLVVAQFIGQRLYAVIATIFTKEGAES